VIATFGTTESVDYAAAGLGALLTGIVTYRVVRPHRVLGPPWAISIITAMLTFLALLQCGSMVLIAHLILAFAVPVVLLIGIARRYGLLPWGEAERRTTQSAISNHGQFGAADSGPQAIGSESESSPLSPAQPQAARAKTRSSPSSGGIIPMTPFKTGPDQAKRSCPNRTKRSTE